MTAYKDIVGIVPTLHSYSLVRHNLKKRKKKRLVKLFGKNIVGTSLIRAESEFINSI